MTNSEWVSECVSEELISEEKESIRWHTKNMEKGEEINENEVWSKSGKKERNGKNETKWVEEILISSFMKKRKTKKLKSKLHKSASPQISPQKK